MKFNRIIVIVTDSVGAGGAPDAERFGDKGADTYGHIDANVPLSLPNLRRMGLGKVANIHHEDTDVVGSYGLMEEISMGKDTTSGHWEFMGNPVENPFPTFERLFRKISLMPLRKRRATVTSAMKSLRVRKSSPASVPNTSRRGSPSSIRRRTASFKSPLTTTSFP